MYYFKNSTGTKIVLRNATKICGEIISFLENQKPLPELIIEENLKITAKKGLENIKANKEERIKQVEDNYSVIIGNSKNSDSTNSKSKKNNKKINNNQMNSNISIDKEFGSIVGFGDYDPALIVTLQIIDHKDEGYPRKCIFNENMKYCGVFAVESDKLKVVAMSNFSS